MSDESLDALREAFADVDESVLELREEAREAALELAGRSGEPPSEVDGD